LIVGFGFAPVKGNSKIGAAGTAFLTWMKSHTKILSDPSWANNRTGLYCLP
jgi:hypothetical protein